MPRQNRPSNPKRWLGPGELARQANTSIKALRVYEKAGLLTADRREGGWRAYGPEHIARLHQILALKALGLPLKQIGVTLKRSNLAIGQILELQAQKLASDIRLNQSRLRRLRQAREHLAEHGSVPPELMLELSRNLAPPAPLDLPALRTLILSAAQEEGAEETVNAVLRERQTPDDALTEAQIAELMSEAAILAAEGDPASPAAIQLVDRWLALAGTMNLPGDDSDDAVALRRVAVRMIADPRLSDTFSFLRTAIERRTSSSKKG